MGSILHAVVYYIQYRKSIKDIQEKSDLTLAGHEHEEKEYSDKEYVIGKAKNQMAIIAGKALTHINQNDRSYFDVKRFKI
jgi:hypothetical protein